MWAAGRGFLLERLNILHTTLTVGIQPSCNRKRRRGDSPRASESSVTAPMIEKIPVLWKADAEQLTFRRPSSQVDGAAAGNGVDATDGFAGPLGLAHPASCVCD